MIKHVQDDPTDFSAFAFVLFTCHLSACKIQDKEPTLKSADEIEEKLTINQITEAFELLFPKKGLDEETDPEKKT